ncbi:MAG: response regulator [Rickettsiales bacterium]|nr:response regulator [Rickettsiales bacterium]
MSEERKVKILCAEDEQDIRENIAEILRDEGFEVFEAANGKLAFESFLQNKPDIVISDIMMPELDGYGLLELIRGSKNVRNNTVPFIFLSALGQKENVIKGVNSSANDYLIKPIDFDLMIAKIKEKTSNLIKVQETHERNIDNLKSQVSLILPAELFSYLDVISQVSSILKEEPYGPFPHRRYIEDLDKIYLNALKLRSSINNSLDQTVIGQRLNADEEVFRVTAFVDDFVAGLSEKFRSKINFERPFEEATTPRLKMDRLVLLDAFRKIFAGMFKTDPEAAITVAIMSDHLDQMVIIFYLKSQISGLDLSKNLDSSQVSKILDQQNCRFEIVSDKENTAVLTVPSYRLIK